MASVTSLDQDMRKLRADRYTPQAASEIRTWIENTLNESVPQGDLLDILKDGVILCRLANLVLAPQSIKYKTTSMPFSQRENISQFLTACEQPPLNLHAHDRFLTVDLYDGKDPAQVLQCIGAFSRAANAVKPSTFPTVIGPKRAGGPSSPTKKNFSVPTTISSPPRGTSGVGSTYGANNPPPTSPSPTHSNRSSVLSPAPNNAPSVTSWSKKSDEAVSAPAWNIHQYGYMGGASQGNQGISFGAKRQIISASPQVPSLAEKEKWRKEEEAENQRRQAEAEDVERLIRSEQAGAEARRQLQEQERKDEEAKQAREEERRQVEEERKRWEEEERRWRDEEQRGKQEQEESKTPNRPTLTGQYLSQYQAEQRTSPAAPKPSTDNDRIRELERQLEEAKERERKYQMEREERNQTSVDDESLVSVEAQDTYRRPQAITSPSSSTREASAADERTTLRQAWTEQQQQQTPPQYRASPRPLPIPGAHSSRNSPSEDGGYAVSEKMADLSVTEPRKLPEPTTSIYNSTLPKPPTRTDRFLEENPAPTTTKPRSHFPEELGLTSEAERAAEDSRRVASQQQTKAGGWASKSLLEREMERERERQREWEEAQMTKTQQARLGRAPLGPRELKR